MQKYDLGLTGFLFHFGILALFVSGYILNIVRIAQDHSVVDFMLILRCVGLAIAPLGAVLGFF